MFKKLKINESLIRITEIKICIVRSLCYVACCFILPTLLDVIMVQK